MARMITDGRCRAFQMHPSFSSSVSIREIRGQKYAIKPRNDKPHSVIINPSKA
jgi:hypothetical protein